MKELFLLKILSFVLLTMSSNAQQTINIDSLLTLLKTDNNDTNKINNLNKLCDGYRKIGEYDKGLLYGKQALQLAVDVEKKTTQSLIKHAAQRNISTSYNNIGIIYMYQGNYPEALKNYLASLKIREELGDKQNISRSYNNIGIIYTYQGNYSEALKNYLASLKIDEELGQIKELQYANTINNIGNINYNQGNYSEALKNHFTSLKIREELNDKQGISRSYNNIGNIYKNQGNYHEALKNYITSLKFKEEIDDKDGIATCFINLGTLYIKLQKNGNALNYLNKALQLSKEIGSKERIKNSYSGLADLDSAKGYFKGAYENYKLYILYRDSIDNEETRKKTVQTQMTYEFEKKEAVANAEHKKEMENQKTLAEEKNRKQKMVIGFVVIGLLLVLAFAGLILRSLRITRQQKRMIETQKDEISAQRDMVTEQKEHIEEIHKEVTDSIQYAKRIQAAVLPSIDYIKEKIHGDFFILFKPKDIVSGDFYFVDHREKLLYIAVADCTGHGVPGAFMSMLGYSFLNEIIIKEDINLVGNILDQLRSFIIKSLQQKGVSGEQKDGMDIALCAINMDTLEMQFAGANNPLYVIARSHATKQSHDNITKDCFAEARNDDHNLIELKPDKQPIGIYTNMQPFTNQTYQLQKGDILYLMSDGYEDQFGGPHRKKFLAKKLKNQLIANCQKPMADQKQILETNLADWIGTGEQIDDITVLGIKI